MRIFTEETALELAQMLLQNDKNIKDELDEKIPSIDGLASKDYVDNSIRNVEVDLTGYATESFVANSIANAQLNSDGDIDLSGYATKDDLRGYAAKNHTHTEYLTEHQDLSNYAKKSDISGLASTAYVDNAVQNVNVDLTDYATTEYVEEALKDVDVDLSNYYDKNETYSKSEVDTAIANAQIDGGNVDLSAYALKSELPTNYLSSIPDEYVTETEMSTAISNALGGDVVVDTRVLASISAAKTKTTYNVDDNIELDDVVVTATYADGTTSVVSGWTSNIDEVNTFVDGYKKLEISYYHNGVVKTTSIPLTVNFSNTADNIQYGYCIADRGRLVNKTNVIKLTTKLLKRSVVNVRMKIKVVVERNSNSGYTTLGFGDYTAWKNNTLASIILSPNQKGEFIIECNKEFEYNQPNLQVGSDKDTILAAVYNNSGNKADGYFEVLDYSISVTQEAPLVVESISAAKTQTRYVIGENVDSSDIVVTALMSDDTTKTVSGFTTELDVNNIDDYGKTPLSIIYTEDGVTNTTTITLKMYRPFLTEAQEFRDITNFELHNELGLGINIGNCLDSKATATENVSVCSYDGWLNQETAWGQPEIIRQNFIDIREKGFNTVRIPITWCYNSGILEDGRRHPGKYWLARVNEVVQIGLEEGLYVMINMHHEQPIIYAGVSDAIFEEVLKNAGDLWTFIADGLKHYNEKLIFEGFNEVDNLESSFNYGDKAALQMNRLNQAFVDAVRSTGSNNAKRILACPTIVHINSIPALNAFTVPNDVVENKILLAVHAYPLTFVQDLENILKPLEEYSLKYNLPVVITEWGSDSKAGAGTETAANLPYGVEQRPAHAANFVARTTNRGIKSYWWDNGSNFTLVIRCNKTIDYGYVQSDLDKIIDAMKDGYNNRTAYVLPEENLISFTSMDDLFYERLDVTTGESKHNYWSDLCTDYIPVTPGKGINIEVVKGAEATKEKVAFVNIVFVDANKVPIESYTGGYMATRYAGTIPQGAAYIRFSINSPHNNIKESKYMEMFASGDLTVNMICYTKDEITKVTLGNRTVADTVITKTVTQYEIGDTFDSSDIAVTAVLSDGTNININDFNVDHSAVNMTTAGEYEVTISYTYNGQTISDTISVFVGDTLMGITVTKTKTEYLPGETLDVSDIVVTANYSSNTSKVVTDSCVIDSSAVDTENLGNYTINVSYTENGIMKTSTVEITVIEFDINNYINPDIIVINNGDITTNKNSYTISETVLANYPYVVCENNNPCHFYLSQKPMYVSGQEGYVVFDITCTMKQVNNNAPVLLTPSDSAVVQVVGNYYCNKSKCWILRLANYDVCKWVGGGLPA